MFSRRQLLGAGAASAALVSSQSWSQTTNMGLPEAAVMESAATQKPVKPSVGPDYNPDVCDAVKINKALRTLGK